MKANFYFQQNIPDKIHLQTIDVDNRVFEYRIPATIDGNINQHFEDVLKELLFIIKRDIRLLPKALSPLTALMTEYMDID